MIYCLLELSTEQLQMQWQTAAWTINRVRGQKNCETWQYKWFDLLHKSKMYSIMRCFLNTDQNSIIHFILVVSFSGEKTCLTAKAVSFVGLMPLQRM